MKKQLIQYMLDTYGIEADYPWMTAPENAIFRNPRNQKWFAVLLGQLSKRCLGLLDDGNADVLNLKCDPLMTFSLIDNRRIFRAYHMNKEHWISILLDSGITMDELSFLVDLSYRLIDQKGTRTTRKNSRAADF